MLSSGARNWSLGCRVLALKGCPLLTWPGWHGHSSRGWEQCQTQALPFPEGHPPGEHSALQDHTLLPFVPGLLYSLFTSSSSTGWKSWQLQVHPGRSHQHPPPWKSIKGFPETLGKLLLAQRVSEVARRGTTSNGDSM